MGGCSFLTKRRTPRVRLLFCAEAASLPDNLLVPGYQQLSWDVTELPAVISCYERISAATLGLSGGFTNQRTSSSNIKSLTSKSACAKSR